MTHLRYWPHRQFLHHNIHYLVLLQLSHQRWFHEFLDKMMDRNYCIQYNQKILQEPDKFNYTYDLTHIINLVFLQSLAICQDGESQVL